MTVEPVYLTRVEVQGVRCFTEPVAVDLTDPSGGASKWTVVLGENGVGKTTLAQLLTLGAADGSIGDGESGKRRGAEALERVTLGAQGRHRVTKSVERFLHTTQTRQAQDGQVYGEELVAPAIPWCLLAYGAHRRVGEAQLGEGVPGWGVETLFDGVAELLNVEEWLLRLRLDAALRGDEDSPAARELHAAREVLPKLLPDVIAVDIPKPPPDRRPGDLRGLVVFRTVDGDVPFSGLSLGYRTIAAMAVDMAARMFAAWPNSPDPLAEPAVCVIDEIDLHLHPRWQREVVGYLRSRFPKTQFIVTTHSPLIVQASGEDANVVVLYRDASGVVRVDNDPARVASWRVDQILTSELFGVPSPRSVEVEARLARRTELATRKGRTQAEDLELTRLHAWADTLPSQADAADQDALDAVRALAARLKAGNP